MSFIYTHNTSPRKFKRVIKNKSYHEAVEKQNKLLRAKGIIVLNDFKFDKTKEARQETYNTFYKGGK